MTGFQIQTEDFSGPADQAGLVEKKIQEADLYLNHGLVQEARAILEEILAEFPEKSAPELRKIIKQKLDELSLDPAVRNEDGREDKADDLSTDEQFSEHFNNCLGLVEAGFFSEAVEEFKILEGKGPRKGEVRVKIGQL